MIISIEVLFAACIGTCAAFLAIGNMLDKQLKADAKNSFASKLAIAVRPDPVHWMQAMSAAFLILFDRIYGWRRSVINKMLWQVIILCYGIFVIARLILWGFGLPVPDTELILTASIYTAIGAILLLQSLRGFTSLTEAVEQGIAARSIVNRALVVSLLCGMVLLVMIVLGAWLTILNMGPATRHAIALSMGAAFALALVVPVAIVPDRAHPVNPLRAVLSSFAFMFIIGLIASDSTTSFVEGILEGRVLIISFVAFNVFADAISLVETRWILVRSQRVGLLAIFGLLMFDILLSGGIYLILPVIANQDLTVLTEALAFRGTMPWMGILFWTTFSTSAVFYLFVMSVLVCKVFTPILRLLHRWIDIDEHPVGTVACAMAIVASAGFLLFGLLV